ncbi:MAG: hypothetical protein Kow002_01230 [Anaerolineales bacterium]
MQRMENIPSTTTQEPEDTITMKRSLFYSVLVVFAFTVGVLFGYLIWGRTVPAQQIAQEPAAPSVQEPAAQAPAPTEEPQNQYTRYDIPTEGFPSLGPEDAEIVIVEFSDYQ